MPSLYEHYLQAKEKIVRYEPRSLITEAVFAMHEQYREGVEGFQRYRPWDILLAIQWTLQEAVPASMVRMPATRNDLHDVLNIIYEMDGVAGVGTGYEGLLHFMRRMAFQQFPLQDGPNTSALARQYLLFSSLQETDPIAAAFRDAHGLTLGDACMTAYMIYLVGVASEGPELKPDLLIAMHNLRPAPFGALMNLLTKRVPALHRWLASPERAGVKIGQQRILLSPLIDAPLLRLPSGKIISYYPALLMRSLETLVYRTLRHLDVEDTVGRFGTMFEDHLARCLDCAQVLHTRETELQRRIGDQKKCVDFLVEETDCDVLIEAKAVELSTIGQGANDTEFLFQALKPIIKALHQGFATRVRLDALKPAGTGQAKDTFLVVVTHSDLNLGSNSAWSQMLKDRLIRKLGREFGEDLPIPFENIFLISALEFEGLLELIRTGRATFGSAFRFSQAQDRETRTQKFKFRQHLSAMGGSIALLPILKNAIEELSSHVRLSA
jgi:hypothetical protein